MLEVIRYSKDETWNQMNGKYYVPCQKMLVIVTMK